MNDWAKQIATRREQLEADRTRLLADHERMETERARIAKLFADTEARIPGPARRGDRPGQVDRDRPRAGLHEPARRDPPTWSGCASGSPPRVARAIGHTAIPDQAKAKIAGTPSRPAAR